jgi:hypothetical protein
MPELGKKNGGGSLEPPPDEAVNPEFDRGFTG